MQRRSRLGRFVAKSNGGILYWFIGGILAIFAVTGIVSGLGGETYTAPVASSTPEVIEVAPQWAEDEDAVAAAKAVIRRKELEAELEQLSVEKSTLEERIEEIEKELGTY